MQTNLILNLVHTLELNHDLELVMDSSNWTLYHKSNKSVYLSGSSNDKVADKQHTAVQPALPVDQVVERNEGFLYSKERLNRSSKGLDADQAVQQAIIMELFHTQSHIVISEGKREYVLVEMKEDHNITKKYYFTKSGGFVYGVEEEIQYQEKESSPITGEKEAIGRVERVISL